MESKETTNKPTYARNPEWTVRAFEWLMYSPTWNKVALILALALLMFVIGAVGTILGRDQTWGFWTNLIAYGVIPSAALGILFYIAVGSLTRIVGHRIIAYVPGPDALRKLSASDLEHLTGEVYRMQGHKVKRRGVPGQPDKGVDLEILRRGKRGIIQCKRWTHENIGVDKLRELHGAMVDANADFAIFVTTSDFTEPAEQYAADKPIELVNLGKLWEMVADAKLEDVANMYVETQCKLEIKDRQQLLCPQCGNSVVLRKSKHGHFLGCKSWHETGCNFLINLKRG